MKLFKILQRLLKEYLLRQFGAMKNEHGQRTDAGNKHMWNCEAGSQSIGEGISQDWNKNIGSNYLSFSSMTGMKQS